MIEYYKYSYCHYSYHPYFYNYKYSFIYLSFETHVQFYQFLYFLVFQSFTVFLWVSVGPRVSDRVREYEGWRSLLPQRIPPSPRTTHSFRGSLLVLPDASLPSWTHTALGIPWCFSEISRETQRTRRKERRVILLWSRREEKKSSDGNIPPKGFRSDIWNYYGWSLHDLLETLTTLYKLLLPGREVSPLIHIRPHTFIWKLWLQSSWFQRVLSLWTAFCLQITWTSTIPPEDTQDVRPRQDES